MPIEVIMPKVDMDMETGTLAVWHRQEGELVEKGEPLFDIETDKATMEVEAPGTGILQFVTAKKDAVVPIGGNVAWIFAEGEEVVAPAGAAPQSAKPEEAAEAIKAEPDANAALEKTSDAAVVTGIRATPLARRVAGLEGVDLSLVKGSGPRGRILKADVDSASLTNAFPVVAAPSPAASNSDVKKTADNLGIGYTEIPVDRMRATIAARLTESKSTVPHFYLQADCQLDALLAFRAEINTALEAAGSKRLSINDMLVRASALSLAAVPEANASWAGDSIIRYDDANISVAVAIDGGLITPVVRQAQSKGMQTISTEIADLAARARTGKLSKNEYQGGSFSISNLGMFGIKSFSAIINPPESMILAVGKATRQFIPDDNGNPIAATVLCVTLSCDHRVVDGSLGAKWLQHFQSLIENPILLTLDPVKND